MRGRLELRFNAPNVGKLRSRVNQPSKDLSNKVRELIAKAVAEAAEGAQYELKAKILKGIAAMEKSGEIKFNNPSHRSQVFDITSDIFAVYLTATKEEFDARFPAETKSGTESPGTETPESEVSEGIETPVGEEAPANDPDEFED